MNTTKNVLKLLGTIALGVYLLTSAALMGWLYYQPEPSMPEAPQLGMLLDGELHDVGWANVFCYKGIAWEETGFMGINAVGTVDGRMQACEYVKRDAEWANTALYTREYAIEL